MHTATNGFSDDNKLGEGGFGSVYWGRTSDGLQVTCTLRTDVQRRIYSSFGCRAYIYIHTHLISWVSIINADSCEEVESYEFKS